MHYHSGNTRINSDPKASTVCRNLVEIGSVTSEFKKEFVEFLQKVRKKTGQNLAYFTK